ncbi:MAG: DMT family transporter [Lachnospiraceae bacterium]|nr:DMT family transporter [Lachnospiraceae bacterium]
MSKNLKGMLLLTGAAVIWGFAFVAQRQGGEALPPFTFTAVRSSLGAVVLVFVTLITSRIQMDKGTFDRERARISLKGGIIAGMFMGAAINLQQVAMVTVPAGKSGFLTALYIVIVPVLSVLFMKRRVRIRVWIAVFLAVAALYLITGGGLSSPGAGDVLLVGCAFLFALQILTLSLVSPNGYPVMITAVEFVLTALVSWVPALLFEKASPGAYADALLPILYTGIMSSAVAYGLQTAGQALAEPEGASLAMSLEAVFATFGGAVILGEVMTIPEYSGCALMFFAVLLCG